MVCVFHVRVQARGEVGSLSESQHQGKHFFYVVPVCSSYGVVLRNTYALNVTYLFVSNMASNISAYRKVEPSCNRFSPVPLFCPSHSSFYFSSSSSSSSSCSFSSCHPLQLSASAAVPMLRCPTVPFVRLFHCPTVTLSPSLVIPLFYPSHDFTSPRYSIVVPLLYHCLCHRPMFPHFVSGVLRSSFVVWCFSCAGRPKT